MADHSYIIKYTILSHAEYPIKEGTIRVKNKMSELHAKVSLEKYLQKKYSDFNKLIIHNCHCETCLGIFEDIFNNFKDT